MPVLHQDQQPCHRLPAGKGRPDDPQKIYAGVCGCGTPDKDIDVDDIWDCFDEYIDIGDFDRGVNPSSLTDTSESAACFIEGLQR